MANLLRLTNNVYNQEMKKVLNSIDKEFSEFNFGSKTPIPNQVLPTDLNDERAPSTIYFSKDAFNQLQKIREVDHHCSVLRSSKGISNKPINFACFGYRDWDGNIFINSIEVPLFEYLASQKLSGKKGIEAIVKDNKIPSKELHTDATCRVFDYLRENRFVKDPIGSELVALCGTTKHTDSLYDAKSNCFTLGELAESVLPNVKVKENITSGMISITPKTIDATRVLRKKMYDDTCLIDGSIECALISYVPSGQSGYVKPSTITNVTRAIGVTNSGHVPIRISSSDQPIQGLYHGKSIPRDAMKQEMEK